MVYGEFKQWAEGQPIAAILTIDDAQTAFPGMSRDAIQVALGRLCAGDDPLLARPARGYYCRREQGLPYPKPIPFEIYDRLPWIIAGPGAAMSSMSVINQLGWSTQIPGRTWIAVVGRAPQPPFEGLTYLARSNQLRSNLSLWEASLLEAARFFDRFSEMPWDEALDKFTSKAARGSYGDCSVQTAPLLETAAGEQGLGPDFNRRIQQLAEACGDIGEGMTVDASSSTR